MNYPDPKKGILSYEQDPNKRIVVTYSSIMGNGWGGYGETVMGSKGTLILDREQEVLLFKESDASTKIGVKDDKGGPTMDTQASGKGPSLAKAAADSGPVSRGYTEEIEHWAWCIRNPSPQNRPKCHPKVAMADAIIALVSNMAIRDQKRIEFKPEWFEIDSDETPEGVKLFRNRAGKPWTIATAGRGLAKLATNAGVKANGGPLSLYSLRHSYATRKAKILSIDELRKLMGHKDTRQLEGLYDHSASDADYMDSLARKAG